MSDSLKFVLRDEASREDLLTLEYPGTSLLYEELYGTTAAKILVSHGLYYTIEHRRIHTEVGAGFESHEVVVSVVAGAAGGAAGVVVQQVATAIRKLAATLANKHEKLSEAEAVQAAIEYAEALNDPPAVTELVVRDTGTRIVKLTTATERIRVELDQHGILVGISRRKKRVRQTQK